MRDGALVRTAAAVTSCRALSCILCAFLLTFGGPNQAQAVTYPLVSFTELNGVIVRDVHQDSRGFIWLATDCGLWRWDRDGFDPVRAWGAGASRSLVEDDYGILWVGTADGVHGIDVNTLTLRDDRRSLSGFYVRRLYRDPHGRIWCGTLRGLYRLEPLPDGCKAMLVEGTEAYQITSIVSGEGDDLWLGTKGNVLQFRDGSIIRSFFDIVGTSTVEALLWSSDGSLWVGLRKDDGLYRIANGIPIRMTRQDGLLDEGVNALVELPGGEVLVGTEGGVHRWTDGGFKLISRRTGMVNQDVHALMVDRENQVWIGTYGGGVYLLHSPYVLTYGLDDGLRHPVVTSLARNPEGGLVVGTIEGATRFVSETGSSAPHGPAEHVSAVYFDQAGVGWIGGPSGIWWGDDSAVKVPVPEVLSICEGGDGHLYVGTTHGLWLMDGGRGTRIELPEGLPGAIQAVFRSRDGSLYLGSPGGLLRGNGSQWNLALPNRDIRAICEDNDGRLWLGTPTGLLALDKSSPATPLKHWPSAGEVRGLACDDAGTVWAATDDGIVRVRNGESERFTLGDGLPSRDVRAVLLDGTGHLYAATTQGLARIDTQRLAPCPSRPRIVLDGFVVGGRALASVEGHLSIPYADHALSIQVRHLGWRSATGVRYQYKLEGRDRAWSAPTLQGTQQYTLLAPGDYTLLARCVDAHNRESENVVKIGFTILPPLWRTGRFAVFLGAAVAVAVLLAVALFVKRARLLAERRETRKALQASETRYRALFEQAPDSIVLIDAATGALVEFNDRAHENLGYGRAEFQKLTLVDIEAIESEEQYRSHVARIHEKGSETFETRHRSKDGSVRDVRIDARRVAIGGRALVHSIWTDITERKRMERSLRESEERYRSLIETAPYGVQECDASGIIVFSSAPHHAMMNCKDGELVGKAIWDLLARDDERDSLRDYLALLVRDQPSPTTYTTQNRTHDGRVIDVQVDWNYKRNRAGEVTGFTSIITDITERTRIEKALRESEVQFRTLAETVTAATFIFQGERLLYANPAAVAITGYSREELLDKPFWEIIHPEFQDRVRQRGLARQRGAQVPQRYEVKILNKSGETLWVEFSAGMIEYGGGLAVLGTAFDITQRKEAEASLRESEHRYRAIVEDQTEFICRWLPGGVLTFVNDSYCRYLGRRREDLIGRTFIPEIPLEDQQVVRDQLASLSRTNSVADLEHRVIAPGGEVRWQHWTNRAICDTDGNVIEYQSVGRDITERRQVETALRESEERFRQIAETISEVFWMASPDWGELHYVSPAYEELWGRSRQSLYDEPLSWLDAVHPDDRERVLAEMGKKARGTPFDPEFPEYRIVRPDGSVRWILARAYPVHDESGQVLRVAGIAEDITEQRRHEENLRLQARILDNMSEGVILVRARDGEFVYANPTFERMFGYDPGELDGKQISTINAAGDRSPQETEGDIVRSLEADGVWKGEVHNVKKDGTRFWCHANVSTFEHPAFGQVWLSVHQDITERRLAEKALRESEGRQGLIMHSLPMALYTADASGEFGATWVSHQVERISGFPPDRWVGDPQFWVSGLHPDDRERALSEYGNLLIEGEVSTEYRWRCADGSYRWFLDQAVLLRDESGRPKEAIGTWLDITERKRVEVALRESEEKYRSLFEQADDSIVLVDLETGGLSEFNRRAHDNLGYTRDELRKLTIPDFEVSESAEEVAAHMQKILAEGADEFETRHRHKDGTIRDILVNSKVVKMGGREFCQSIWRDITEQKRAQGQLRLTQRCVDGASVEVFWIDSNARFTYVNEAACSALGYSRDELLSMTVPDISPLYSQEAWSEAWSESARAGSRFFEAIHRAKDGREFPVEIAVNHLAFEGRELVHAYVHDITERRNAEEQSRRNQAALAHGARLATMGEMATGLAHELGQPLATISNLLHVCRSRIRTDELDREELSIDLENAAAQAKRAGDIVHGIRDFVQKREARYRPEAVTTLVRKAIELMQVELRDNETCLRLELAESLPPVSADAIQIQQVIVNLVRNSLEAFKAADAPTREVTIRSALSGSDWIEISVGDSGPGLSDEDRRRAFEPFFTTRSDGMGMGLSICRSIIESHGGRLWTTSNPHEGATFRCSLPVDRRGS